MCVFFDAQVPKQCTEDDAEEVSDKEKVNFCEWYKPSAEAFDPDRAGQTAKARSDLDALFGGETDTEQETDQLTQDAEDLFK